MSYPRSNVTDPHHFCWMGFVVAFLFQHAAVSDGALWIKKPTDKSYGYVGFNVSIQWHYNLSSGDIQSVLSLKRDMDTQKIARRVDSVDMTMIISESYKGKALVFGGYDIKLVLLNVNASDEDRYCCTVEYVSGGRLKTIHSCSFLEVVDPPTIIYSPKNITANVSETVRLYCNATGRPAPSIAWTKLTDPSTILARSNRLDIMINGTVNEGKYMCNATNGFGEPSTAGFFIKVQYKPSVFILPQTKNVTEGENCSLFCNATGNPRPRISWRRYGSVDGELHNDTKLAITKANRTDAGEYTCTASNLLGSVNATAKVVVYFPPDILSTDKKMVITETSTLQMFCTATGNPVPLVALRKYGSNRNLNTSLGNVTYSIYNTSRHEAGRYECVASNRLGNDSETITVVVQYKPSIVTPLRDLNVTENGDITLYCNATGIPPPVIKWIKDGSTIGNESMLVKTNLKKTDAGQYQCNAINKLGSDEQTAMVDVHYSPSIDWIKDIVTFNETMSINIFCNATGNPRPRVYWVKQGSEQQRLSNDYREAFLKKSNATKNDAGIYLCIAVNGVGNNTKMTTVKVQYKPSIVTPLRDLNVTEHGDITLYCNATGIPPPVIKWIKDGSTIGNESMLVKTNVKKTDAGQYQCNAINKLGSDEQTAMVDVHYAPSIDWIKDIVTFNETMSINIFCNATGNPRPRVYWVKQGSEQQRLSNDYREAFLKKSNATKNDAGIYLCIAVNGVGNNTKMTTVKVQYKPYVTRLIINTQNNIAVINESVELKCVTDAVPPATLYEFYFNGSHVSNSTNGTRIIGRVSPADEGTHKCVPYNVLGQGQQAEVYMKVYERPSITQWPANVTLNETGTFTLQCRARGIPSPDITWSKEGSSTILSHEENFTLSKATKEQAGTYRCTASNGIRKPASATAIVVINFKPAITLPSQVIESQVGHTAELVCVVTGVPLPDVTWSRNGTVTNTKLSSSRLRSGLKVTPNNVKDFGDYTCEARNFMGRQYRTITLKMIEKPGIPSITKLDPTVNSIEIQWEAPASDGGSRILGYRVEAKKKEGKQERFHCPGAFNESNARTCTVEELDSDTMYTVYLSARNTLGFGKVAQEDVKTKPGEGSEKKFSRGLSKTSMIGIGVGAAVLVVFIIIVIVVLVTRMKTQQADFGLELCPPSKVHASHDNPQVAENNYQMNEAGKPESNEAEENPKV